MGMSQSRNINTDASPSPQASDNEQTPAGPTSTTTALPPRQDQMQRLAQLDPGDLPFMGSPPGQNGPNVPNGQAPPLPATILHPSPPSRPRVGPPQINNPRSNLVNALSYFLPISTPDLTHQHPSASNAHPPSHIRLTTLYLTRAGLPAELIPRILDEANYWTVCSRQSKRTVSVSAGQNSPRTRRSTTSAPWTNGQEEDLVEIIELEDSGLQDDDGKVWFLVSEPIGCAESMDRTRRRDFALERGERADQEGQEGVEEGEVKVYLKEIFVTTMSKDQGWSSSGTECYGTYEQSYTWFELSLLRDGKEVKGSRVDYQHNVHAGQYFKEHRHVFDVNDELVKLARPGDRVVLWVRAQYPGWRNNLREATLSIFTSPYPTQAL